MGRPRILDENLIKKISLKTGRDTLSIGKSISALGGKKHISSEVALIFYANKLGIGTSAAFKALDPYKQTQLNNLFNNSGGVKSNINGGKNRRLIKDSPQVEHDFFDPYLKQSIYKSIPSEGYSIMFVLENSMRNFIEHILQNVYGNSWWDEVANKKALSDIVAQVTNRKLNESENWHHAKRGVHEIYYTDYSHLLKIIKTFNSDFLTYFRKGKEKNLLEKLEELTPSRNVIAHNNPISSDDLDRLKIHAKDWFKYMQYIKNKSKI